MIGFDNRFSFLCARKSGTSLNCRKDKCKLVTESEGDCLSLRSGSRVRVKPVSPLSGARKEDCGHNILRAGSGARPDAALRLTGFGGKRFCSFFTFPPSAKTNYSS